MAERREAFYSSRTGQARQAAIMGDNCRDITIIKVIDPGNFLAKECPGLNMSADCRVFNKMQDQMNRFFSDDQSVTQQPPQPVKDAVYAGKRESDRQWYRVRVKMVQVTSKGPKALCYFVDHGEEEYIQTSWLKTLPDVFFEVPEQVQRFSLYGIEPLSMTLEETDLHITKQRCKKWDTSATGFMKGLVESSTDTKAEVISVFEGVVYVKLYLSTPSGLVCANDLLCQKEYATEASHKTQAESDQESGEARERPRRLRKKISPDQILETYLKQIEDEERLEMQSGNLGNSSDSQFDRDAIDSRDESFRTNAVAHATATGRSGRRKPGGGEPVSLSDMEFTNSALSTSRSVGGRGRVLEREVMELKDVWGKVDHGVNVNRVTTGRNSASEDGGESPTSLSLRLRNRIGLNNQGTVSDSELPRHVPMGRGFSFLSGSSDSDNASRQVGTKADVSQSVHARAQLPPSVDSDSTSLVSIMGFEPDGGSNDLSKPFSDVNNRGVQGESFCDIFVPSRLPKCATASAKSEDKKMGSILKKSPSVSSQESNSVRFSESLSVRSSCGTEEFIRKKGKEEGRKLLMSLSPGAGQQEQPPLPRLARPDCPENDPYLGVVVHGISQPSPILDLMSLPFAELVKQTIFKKKYEIPRLIQAYCWPSVHRGRHVIGIAPPKSGKTLAYLPPLLTQLFETTPYTPVPIGNGPLALILVPSWKKAQDVFDTCKEFIQERTKPRVLAIYAGGCEDSQVVPLINGCEILVATPSCLQRMMEKKYTNLKRLCHLLLDDAEILTEVFTSEIQYVMKEYAKVLRESKLCADVPRQRIIVGCQWTQGIQSFMQSYLHEPIVVITSKMEAAVYGQVKQIVHMCKHEKRTHQLSGILEGILTPGNKIMLCSSSSEEVNMLYRLLRSWSHHALLCNEEMSDWEASEMARQWRTLDSKDAAVIMVISDICVTDTNIKDATVVIHYDLPKSKTRFGNRMATMLNYFHNFSREEWPVQPVSHILVTDQCKKEIRSLANFLERSSANIPAAMTSFMAGMQMGENEDEEKEFCRQTKAFGSCVNIRKCSCRHRIMPAIDIPRGRGYPDLPGSGEVKMRMCQILDASHYFVRLLEHRGPQKTDLSGMYVKLLMDIAHFFSIKENCKSQASPDVGDLCAIQDGQHFHRVEIRNIFTRDRLLYNMAEIWYVDDGRTNCVDLSKLLTLPAHLQFVPYQAVEVFLCRVKPMDNDSEWTPKSNSFIYEQLNELTLDGCIVLSMGNTLWLDPIVQRKKCETIKVTTNHMRVRDELLKHGLGTNNPKHIEQLYQLCKDCHVDVPQHLLDKYLTDKRYDQTLDTEVLPEDQEYHEVYVSAVATPKLMHIQRKENVKEFEDMFDEINDRMASDKMEFDKELSLDQGTYCLARFSQDNRWYRAQIGEKLPGDKYDIFFCDFGDNDCLTVSELRSLPDKYTGLPCQAIECKLAYVDPRDDSWSSSSGDALWDMTHYLTGEKKLLVAKIMSKSPATYAGCYNYTIDLYDTNTRVDVHLPQELVWKRHATSSSLKDLLPRPGPIGRKMYTSPGHKLEDLCSAIYWGENEKLVIKQSEEVSTVITSQSKTLVNVEAMISCGGVAAVCRLIGYLSNLEAHHHLVESLTLATLLSPRMCEATIAEEVPMRLVRCLEQSNFPVLHQQAAKAISRLVTVSSFKTALEEADLTTTLCDLLDLTDSPEIQCLAFHALASLLDGSESVSEEVLKTPLCVTARDLLVPGVKHDVIEAAITFLANLAAWENSHYEVKKDAMLNAVVSVIENSLCCQCIYEACLFCQHLSRASRKNKTLLLEHRLVIILQSVLEMTLDSRTRRLCQELEAAIAIRLPQQTEILNRPQKILDCEHEESFVPVRWYQNTFRAVLTIKLKGVLQQDISVSDTHVVFRSSTNGKSFNFELFEEIFQQRTVIDVRDHYARVSLKKKQNGKWSRLLKQKQKPVGLQMDFEKFRDSDCEVSDEDAPFLLSKRRERRLPDQNCGRRKRTGLQRSLEDLESSSESASSDIASYSDDERKHDQALNFGL